MISAKGKSEQGSAFILALMLVAAVGLLVVPVIYLASTGLRATNQAKQRFAERYAADAGVEEGIWILEHDAIPSVSSPILASSTFNSLPTNIEIKALPPPVAQQPPPPQPLQPNPSAQNVIVYKIVKPHVIAPCLSGCSPPVTYTLFIENFGNATQQIRQFGECLPPGFTYVIPLAPATAVLTVTGLEKPGNQGLIMPADVDAAVRPIDGSEPPCLPIGGVPRQQVKWVFDPAQGGGGWAEIPSQTVASITFQADAAVSMPAIHFNDAWVELNSTQGTVSSGPTGPVTVEFPKYDISATAGGTTASARATVWQYLIGPSEAFILSWQVE